MNELVRILKSKGYTVKVAFVETDLDETWRRMAQRWIKTGRLIPPQVMRSAVRGPARAFKSIKADEKAHINNNPGMGKPRQFYSGTLEGV